MKASSISTFRMASRKGCLAMLAMLALFALASLRAQLVAAEDLDDGVVEDEVDPAKLGGFPGGKIPSADELLGMLDSMSGLSDEDKEALREELLKKSAAGAGMGAEAGRHVAASSFASEFLMLIGLLALISFIFVFFGYKLYKSLSERERKREEKKKSKQMKKKK